ncbi:helix-turn-helix domain-containing protein [Gordonia sinesedis]
MQAHFCVVTVGVMEAMRFSRPAAEAARTLLADVEGVGARLASHITRAVPDYVDNPLVSEAELRRSCVENLTYILRLVAALPDAGLQGARATGARRASEGVSYASVMAAYRTGTRFVWDELVDRTPPGDRPEMMGDTATVWEISNVFTDAASEAFTIALTDRVRRDQQLRSTLVGGLLDGTEMPATDWNAATKLGFTGGEYVVVSARCRRSGVVALDRVEYTLAAVHVPSAWRLTSHSQEGIVSLRESFGPDELREVLRRLAQLPVGVSERFDHVQDAGLALRQARLALGSATPDTAEVVEFDDNPIGVLLSGNPAGAANLTTILRPVFDDPQTDAAALLHTARVWFQSGSTSEAAEILHMHRNTVRGRLDRMEQLTGLSTAQPAQAALLYAALEATRIQG